MNKCSVQFVCWGSLATCEFAEGNDNTCEHFESGACLCREAQIKALIDEGYEVTE